MRHSSPPRSCKLEDLVDSNLELARTYFLEGIRIGQKGPDGREVVLQNFCIKVASEEVAESPLCEYMRIYYCDTLGAAPAPKFLTDDQRTVDIEPLCAWLLSATPRTRVDALPHLLMTKDVLRRFLSRDITIISARERRSQAALDETNRQLDATRSLLAESEARNAQLDLDIRILNTKLDKYAQLDAQLQQALQLITHLEAKIAKMAAAAETQAALIAGKMDEVRKDTRAKVDVLWEKRMQMVKHQLEMTQTQVNIYLYIPICICRLMVMIAFRITFGEMMQFLRLALSRLCLPSCQ